MPKSEKKPYALMAGVCYGIYGLYQIIFYISLCVRNIFPWPSVPNIILWIATIGMVVALFLKNEKAVIATAGINALLELYDLIDYFTLSQFLVFIAYALVVVLLVLTLKNIAIVQKIWFISGAALLLGYMLDWINYEYHLYFSSIWYAILFPLFAIGGFVLLGLWIKEHDFIPVKNETENADSSQPFDTVIGGADKLKVYKELFDAGIITQEEFDEKKKKVFDL